MNTQPMFKQGMPSEQVTTLLERVQFADPTSPDIDEDNVGPSWGHYQFTAGGISPSCSLTSWDDVGNVATAFKLVAAGLKTCQDARTMCANAGTPQTTSFISDIYLEQILDRLEKCWTDAGGVRVQFTPPKSTTYIFLDPCFSMLCSRSHHPHLPYLILRGCKGIAVTSGTCGQACQDLSRS